MKNFDPIFRKYLMALMLLLFTTFSLKAQLTPGAFITTWRTTAADESITIPTNSDTNGDGTTDASDVAYSYTVDWGDGSTDATVYTGDATHEYATAGDYQVSITGVFPRIYFYSREKILSIDQWGDITWTSMNRAFHYCRYLTYKATDAPNLEHVKDLSQMFSYASSINGDFSSWDVSNVTNFHAMFYYARAFDSNLGNWDFSSANNIRYLLEDTDLSTLNYTKTLIGWASQSLPAGLNLGDVPATYCSVVASARAVVTEKWTISDNGSVSCGADTDILTFSVSNQDGEAEIDTEEHTVTAQVYSGVDLTNLAPEFSLSSGATISPSGGLSQDFTDAVTYTVTSEDGQQSQDWSVTITHGGTSSETDFLTFEITGQYSLAIDETNHQIEVMVPQDSDLATMSPSFTSSHGSVVSPASGVAQDFSSAVTYTVTAQDGTTTQDWTVSVSHFQPFITTWRTTAADESIIIPTTGMNYAYTVDWGDGSNDETVYDGNATHEYATAGDYQVSISGDFPRVYFNSSGDKDKILSIDQWGDINWSSMNRAFYGCSNLTYAASDAPDLSGVTDMSAMLLSAVAFNGDLNSWDVSSVANMSGMFWDATSFNGDLSSWDVSSVTDMQNMFYKARSFNGELSNWDVSNVTSMRNMFGFADNFNGDLSSWDVSSVTDMQNMFYNAGLSSAHYDLILEGWATLDAGEDKIPQNMRLGAEDLEYCTGAAFRSILTYLYGWSISDGGPTATCPTADAVLDAVTGGCSITDEPATAPTATDQSSATITGVLDPVALPSSTDVPFVWRYDDGAGNVLTQMQLGELTNDTAPVPDKATLDEIVSNAIITTLEEPTATDDCAGEVVGTANVTLPLKASTTITWTYTDPANNSSTQTQEVTITDIMAPVPNEASLPTISRQCEAVVALSTPSATDDFIGHVYGEHDATLPITASTTVTWTYTDAANNSATQTQKVVIEDSTAPVADVATLTEVTDQCSVASLTAPSATDNCSEVTVIHDATLPITTSTTVIWIYTDEAGNSSTQTQEVVIEDTTSPVADAESLADLSGECAIEALTAPTATDNCSEVTVTHDATLPITASTTVIWTYTDESGNNSTQTQVVVIDDTTAPVADAESLADLSGECAIESLTAPTATDNCSEVTVTHDATLPIIASTTVTWTYTDESDNSSTQTQQVAIECVTGVETGLSESRTYPNPVTGYFQLSGVQPDELVILDMNGKVKLAFKGRVETYDVHDLAPGVYTMRLRKGQQVDISKFVKR